MVEPDNTRWTSVRNVVVFQVKLALDAIRDLFLSPVAIICGLIDIIKGNSHSESYFQKLMNFGHKTDSWLNLFGNHKQPSKNTSVTDNQQAKPDVNIDQLLRQVESLIREQESKAALTTAAKSKINQYINKVVENKNQK